MFDQLKEILAGKLQVPADLITMEATPESIELDSLATVELSLVLDKELGIKISDDALAAARTVGDIVRLMEERGVAL
ncbi:phosphopantetheine-binding protein [Streptomyces sp. NPDC000151]|uniref:acyl carrier protein n=1 Tax=Streptomyces sp. NPDC000151 TaxID=3154244 RepID=UPI00331FE840